jgi:hypothetical protein
VRSKGESLVFIQNDRQVGRVFFLTFGFIYNSSTPHLFQFKIKTRLTTNRQLKAGIWVIESKGENIMGVIDWLSGKKKQQRSVVEKAPVEVPELKGQPTQFSEEHTKNQQATRDVVSSSDLESEIRASSVPLLVVFWAPWAEPARN